MHLSAGETVFRLDKRSAERGIYNLSIQGEYSLFYKKVLIH